MRLISRLLMRLLHSNIINAFFKRKVTLRLKTNPITAEYRLYFFQQSLHQYL